MKVLGWLGWQGFEGFVGFDGVEYGVLGKVWFFTSVFKQKTILFAKPLSFMLF